MFDTHVTVRGNVLSPPVWRRTSQSGQYVANFKVASQARRLDRESGQWVDSNRLRVRVTCWRKLAEGVAASVMVGDPVVVYGRLYTRDWVDEQENHRVLYELEATSVGHDLSRGVSRFRRNKPTGGTSMIEDEAADTHIGGEETDPAPDMPTGLDPDDPLHDEDPPQFGGLLTAIGGGDPFEADPFEPVPAKL